MRFADRGRLGLLAGTGNRFFIALQGVEILAGFFGRVADVEQTEVGLEGLGAGDERIGRLEISILHRLTGFAQQRLDLAAIVHRRLRLAGLGDRGADQSDRRSLQWTGQGAPSQRRGKCNRGATGEEMRDFQRNAPFETHGVPFAVRWGAAQALGPSAQSIVELFLGSLLAPTKPNCFERTERADVNRRNLSRRGRDKYR